MSKDIHGLLSTKSLQDLLTEAFTLCALNPDLSREAIDSLIARARATAARRRIRPARRKPPTVDYDVLGHVIYIWQRTPSYLDDSGKPLPIASRGPAPSIQGLFRDVQRDEYFERGLRHLTRLKRIRRVSKGRYLPCSEVTIVNGLTPEFANLVRQTVSRLVSTVVQNTSRPSTDSLRLIERVTTVPDLPAKQVRAFKAFAREQGGALINTMNEWLESRRGTRKARAPSGARNFTAGLHVFAFIEKNRR